HYFYARFRHYSKNIFVLPTHIPVFTSRKRLVCFAPYITVSLALAQYFLNSYRAYYGQTYILFLQYNIPVISHAGSALYVTCSI
ncbi:MAG: hypothetical protein WA130_04395, partial [Candidatus Methanoperedens sp.]